MEHNYFQNPQLDGSSFSLEGDKAGVLLIHGFTATTIEVRALAEFLNQHGYAISAPLLPGHGTKPEDLLKVKWNDWFEAVDTVFQRLSQQYEHVIVAGESLGGLLALSLARKYPKIDGIILFAPSIMVKGIWRSTLLAPFVKIRPKGYGGSDPEGHLPWQGYTAITVPAANQLRRFQRVITRSLKHIYNPVLVFQGELDHTVDPQGSQKIYDRIGSSDKELIWLKNSGHCVILDIERLQVYPNVLDFIQRVISQH